MLWRVESENEMESGQWHNEGVETALRVCLDTTAELANNECLDKCKMYLIAPVCIQYIKPCLFMSRYMLLQRCDWYSGFILIM